MNIYLVQIYERKREREKKQALSYEVIRRRDEGRRKERKGTLTTAIYSDHIARVRVLFHLLHRPTNAQFSSFALRQTTQHTSIVMRARSMMNKEEENERTSLYARDREKRIFFSSFSLLHRC